ncbi:MAG: DUF87 domain-containing protein [Halobacteria archaeon]
MSPGSVPAALLLAVLAAASAQDAAPSLGLSTDLGDVALEAGVERTFAVAVTNLRDLPLPVRISVAGAAEALAGPPLEFTLGPEERREVQLRLNSTRPGTYLGTLVAQGGGDRREIPFQAQVRVTLTGQPVALRVEPGSLKAGEVLTVLTSPRVSVPLPGALVLWSEDGTLLSEMDLDFSVPRNVTLTIPAGTPPGRVSVEAAVPRLGSAVQTVTVLPTPFPTYLLLLPAGAAAGVVLLRWREELAALLAGNRRYPPLTAYGELPRGPFAVGRVAGSRKRFELGPEHLRGHVLVAGATGGGKSVAAMVLAEEALRQKWAVVVCDPTLQWTGLLRPCGDAGLLRRYRLFGMGEAGGWPGARKEEPEFDPGDLVPGRLLLYDFGDDYDGNLARLLDRFRVAGSPRVPLLVVLEEIHRALPKYGAPSQLYPLLESVVREFRHRGISLILTSQLLSDFSSEIGDNILTEIQMLTKGPEDLTRLEKKYGAAMARLATRLEPGAGLLHHPQVNGGLPVAVEFRPTLGEPHKLPGPLLERWRDLWARHGRLAAKVRAPEGAQALARARERLETLRLEMAHIYLDEAEGERKKP